MSRFLGPIHLWLFNKIRLYEDLEANIIKEIHDQVDPKITEIAQDLNIKIGNPMPNKPLEELINTNNIHGWLQEKIIIAETRQATLITHIVDKYGGKGLELVKEAYQRQGVECGEDAKTQYDISTAPQLYKALNNYILDGMPCDNVNNITTNDEDRLQWQVFSCLHKDYWESTEGDINVLYELRKIWISNFISNANPSFSYSFNIEDVDGRKALIHEIKK